MCAVRRAHTHIYIYTQICHTYTHTQKCMLLLSHVRIYLIPTQHTSLSLSSSLSSLFSPYIYIHTYIYICRERERKKESRREESSRERVAVMIYKKEAVGGRECIFGLEKYTRMARRSTHAHTRTHIIKMCACTWCVCC